MQAGLCIGTWQLGPSFGFWANRDRNDLTKAFHYLLRNNINWIDTAQAYASGVSEQFVGNQLKFLSHEIDRSSVFLATKLMASQVDPEKLVDKSLVRLKTNYLDALYLHWPNPNIDQYSYLKKLEKLVDQGRVKTLGLSNYSSKEASVFVKDFPITLFQRPVSLIWSKDLDEDRAFCLDYGLCLVGYSPLGMGLLCHNSLDYQDSRRNLYCLEEPSRKAFREILGHLGPNMARTALLWALSKADRIIVGSTNLNQARSNVECLGKTLEPSKIKDLDRLSASLMATTSKQCFLHRPPCAMVRTC